jgi:hypothetical protein
VYFQMHSGLDRAKMQRQVHPFVRLSMYLTDDGILIGLYGLISIFFLLFAAYAAREWRIERRKKRANAHLDHTKAQTWNAFRGEWVADDES